MLKNIFKDEVRINENYLSLDNYSTNITEINQSQTKEVFSEKWEIFEVGKSKEKVYKFQRDWFLSLYGFSSEENFKTFLADKKIILDAGCGLGYKAAWIAELAPHATVIGMDISKAALIAASNYKHLKNLFFVQGDIADTGII